MIGRDVMCKRPIYGLTNCLYIYNMIFSHKSKFGSFYVIRPFSGPKEQFVDIFLETTLLKAFYSNF